MNKFFTLILFTILLGLASNSNCQVNLKLSGYNTLTCNNWLSTGANPSYVTVGDIDVVGTQVTVEATVNRTPLPNDGHVVSKHTGPANINYALSLANCEITTTNGYTHTNAICNPDLNKTYHIAMVYDGSSLKFYRNGFLMNQVPCSGNLITNDLLTTIGEVSGNGYPLTDQFYGYINEVRIWNVARTQTQLRTYMNSSLPSPATQPGLLAYYTFDNLLNKQGNAAFNGTINGAALINTSNPNCNFIADSCLSTNTTISNIINDYTPVLDLDICKNILTVGDATNYKAGDTVLLIQMKGAVIDSTNTPAFGTITNYKNAGNYEFNYIKSKTGNNLELINTLTRNYDIPDGKVQLIRVPYYQNANVNATLTCQAWNGTTGGVLVLNAADSVVLNADIDVSGKGFIGGNDPVSNQSDAHCYENQFYYPPNPDLASGKGEGIVLISSSKSFGKGALANGGGGGNSHNSGGAGGGNINSGGFGGYQYEFTPCDAIVPFDNRGVSGKSLTYSNAANKIFLGGGGGAGQSNNIEGFQANGGNGSAIVIIIADKIKANAKKIIANGNAGVTCGLTTSGCHEGMGGGGAAGTVLLKINNYIDNTTIETKGGKGGDMTAAGFYRVAPGGGGSGGAVWLTNAALPPNVIISNSGGANGVCTAYANDPWGATPGLNGLSLFNLQLPIDTTIFKANIDSVRFNFANASCSKNVNFFGLAYINGSPIVSWHWDFGDGNTDNIQNTSHTYSTSGTFSVKLVATDNNGCKDSIAKDILITSASAFDFSYKQNICNPLSVDFTGAGSILTNPYWSFGDNTSTTGTLTPTHLYTTSGNYLVRFTIDNPAGCSDTISKIVNISTQLANIVLTNDTTICFGTTKLLKALPSASFCWSPSTYLDNPAINNPTTSTPANITYYYTAEILGPNLIINGDFTAGNTGFTSSYNYAVINTLEGEYFVGPNPQAWNGGMAACPDHTTGTGNMLLVNGAPASGTIIWKQTVNITPNTNYNFTSWVQSISTANPAQLQFSINNILIGPVFSPPSTTCSWQRFFSNWNSGNNTTATISIVNQNVIAAGNDFALDDISFAEVTIQRDSVKIIVDTPSVAATGSTSICPGGQAQLNAIGSVNYVWTPTTGLSNPNIANPIATPAATTTYTVSGTNAKGCTAQATAVVTVTTISNFDFSYQQNPCNPLSVQFFGAGIIPINPYWKFGDGNTSLGNASPTHIYPSLGNYTVKYHADNASCPDTITKVISLQLTQADILFTNDTTICFGSTKLLKAQSSASFCWSPTTYLDNPALNNPTTSTPANMTYYYTAEILGANLITNGDFAAGNTGFTSAYNYATVNILEGQYFVGPNPQVWNGGMSACTDHTTGTGNMMLVNGAPTPGTIIWKQTVNITPNTNYNFTCWVQSVFAANPARLQFSINNILIGPVFSPPVNTCSWQRFFSNWNSGSNSTATISIVNQNTIAAGNDFALDDITFSPVSIKRDSVKITVDTPVVAATGSTSVCTKVPAQLNASGATTYSWTPTAGLSNPNIANPVATTSTTTTYTVNGTNARGCIAQASVLVTILPKPIILKSKDTAICNTTSAQLFASGGTIYSWTPAATLDNPNIATPVATPTAQTKYYVTVTNNAVNTCTNSDSIVVSIKPVPVFTISPPQETCAGKNVQLTSSGGNIYLWAPANLVSNAAIANPMTTANNTTNYSVTITESACNISTTLSTLVTVNPALNIDAFKSNDIDCSIGFANLTAFGASQYTWTPSTGLSNNFIANPVATPTITTLYTVNATDASGCTASDTVTVVVSTSGNSTYSMPNSFTPNGDGINDCFGIKYWGQIQDLQFFIFNRYGEKVFSTTDPNKCWDGKYKTDRPENGNYVYYIKAKTACGTVERKGNVILIR